MNDHDFDDLDRALFALPLEVPPADLRGRILRATIDAAGPVPLPFAAYEIGGIGVALAVAVWLVIAALGSRSFALAIDANAQALLRALADPATLAWLAAGGAVALALTVTNLAVLGPPTRNRRS